MFQRTFTKLIITALIIFTSSTIHAKEDSLKLNWPMEIESEKGFVTTLYQPQLESFKSNILEGRMAITIKGTDTELIFGAIWFKARMSTDLDTRTVVLAEINIIKTHFPEMVDEQKTQKFSKLLKKEIESWNLEMSLDRILASLEEVEDLNKLSDQLNNAPPGIYFRKTPAILMMIDGEPKLKKDEESGIEYVVNTPFFIVKDPGKDRYYINGSKFWYASDQLLSGWKETKSIPSKIKKFAKKASQESEPDSVSMSYTSAPELIVDTKAAELVLVDGEIDYKPIDGTTLLYVSNSESDIIMDINSQQHYLLLAGRWYASKSLEDGDWTFIEPDILPEEFKIIPDDSEMSSVKPSIPGTAEAEIALLEQSIPQTATIDRKTAKVEVKYDGNPKFEKIEGTDVSYGVNTDKTVLLINKVYYCVDDAVWFMSDKATGPWTVSVERPDEVNDIPPDAPVYNVKYAYIYDSSPEVVYVGYLPGYTNCYVYGGVVVYGTGYYYKPWYGYYYYPRPVTWGFGVHYNPWTGWGFSVGFSYGWMGWSFHPYHRGYWGARGYHRGYRHGYHRGYHHGYNRGYKAGYAAGHRNANRNVYNNRSNGVKNTGNIKSTRPSNTVNNRARPSNKANNMYTDRSGNVYQRDNKGNFQNRSNSPTTQQRPATNNQKQPSSRDQVQTKQRPANTQQPNTQQNNQMQQLERSHQNRSRGNQNYQRSQQQMQRNNSRPSGGAGRSGGGGRRR